MLSFTYWDTARLAEVRTLRKVTSAIFVRLKSNSKNITWRLFMDYIAHIREKDGEIQTVQEHLDGVRGLSEKFGSKIGVQYLAGLSGLLHDLVKNTAKKAQKYCN